MCFYIKKGKGVAEMKKEYLAPALETIKFDIADIITHSNATSGEGSTGEDGGVNLPHGQSVYMTKRGEIIYN